MVFCYQNCSDLLWEKNCSSDWEKLLKFEAEGREFAKNLPRFQFEGKTDVWICQVRGVKANKYIWYYLIAGRWTHFQHATKCRHGGESLHFGDKLGKAWAQRKKKVCR